MKPEQAFRMMVVELLKPLHPFPVENSVVVGMPDINFSLGWIELKVDTWVGDRMKLTHLTQYQKSWLFSRRMAGGNAWLFVRIDQDHFIFDGVEIFNVQGMTREDCFKNCVAHFGARLPNMKDMCLTFRALARSNDDAYSKSRGVAEISRDDVPDGPVAIDRDRPPGQRSGGVEDVRTTPLRERLSGHLDFGGSRFPD